MDKIISAKKEAYYCQKKDTWCIHAMYDCPELKYGIYPCCRDCPMSETREYTPEPDQTGFREEIDINYHP